MAGSKSKWGVWVAVGALGVIVVAAIIWPREAVPPPADKKDPSQAPVKAVPQDPTQPVGPAVKTPPPSGPRTDLTDAERARVEALVSEANEARVRIVQINRDLVHARGAVLRDNPEARAALEKQKNAQKRRAEAAAADAEIVTLRDKIGALGKAHAALRARFQALEIHEGEHGKPGPAGEPPPKVAGCVYCEEFGTTAALPPRAHQALADEEKNLQEERRTTYAAHLAALQRVDAQPEVAAAIAEAEQAESTYQAILQADRTVTELIREREALTEKRTALVMERATILRPRPAPGEALSNSNETERR